MSDKKGGHDSATKMAMRKIITLSAKNERFFVEVN